MPTDYEISNFPGDNLLHLLEELAKNLGSMWASESLILGRLCI